MSVVKLSAIDHWKYNHDYNQILALNNQESNSPRGLSCKSLKW